MSSPVTLGSMVTSVLARANIENQVFVGGFIQPAEVREYLNEGLTELWEKLVAARGQEHMRKSQMLTMVPGQSLYAVAADLFELLSVDINLSPGGTVNPQFWSAKPYMEGERNRFRFFPGLTGWYWGAPIFYRIQGSPQLAGPSSVLKNINFIPTPQAGYQVILNYYPTFTRFLTDGSQDSYQFDGVSGWEGFPIWYAVALCKAKLKEDGSFANAQVARFEERIAELADQNDAAFPERVNDVMSDDWSGWP